MVGNHMSQLIFTPVYIIIVYRLNNPPIIMAVMTSFQINFGQNSGF